MDDIAKAALIARVKAVWIGRAEALGLKGKRRDEGCLHYLNGVRVGLGGDDTTPTAIDGMMFKAVLDGSKALETAVG